ncbi:MAG: polyhydroxyalkanoate granule-associated phasin [Burkholderiales bacterium]
MRRIKPSRKARSITKIGELAIAAPQVIATRTARMLAAGANPGTADRMEFSQMCTEKVQAFWESLFAMSVQTLRTHQDYARAAALQWWRLCTTPWWLGAIRSAPDGTASAARAATLLSLPSASRLERAMSRIVAAGLGPIHKRATANARRLARPRKRSRKA